MAYYDFTTDEELEAIKAQAEAMQRQAGELNELSVALAKESLKPVQESFTKSFTSLSKSIAA